MGATMQTGVPTEAKLRRVLERVVRLCRTGGVQDYCLIGTAAALLGGVTLEVGDIDLLMRERADVDRFARALAGYPVIASPNWLADARQYYAAFEVDGTKVEASTVEWPTDAEALESLGTGPWHHRRAISVGTELVQTVALELRLATELVRDRSERVAALIEWMRHNGFDAELLRSAMAAQHIDTEVQASVLARLAG